LLIACANVAGLMLARAARGKRKWQCDWLWARARAVVRQLLTESVDLSVLGGRAGILFALLGSTRNHSLCPAISASAWICDGLLTSAYWGFTARSRCSLEFFSASLSTFRGARVDLDAGAEGRREKLGRSGHAGRKWLSIGNALVVAQVALAIVGWWVPDCWYARCRIYAALDVGLISHNILVFGIDPTLIGYKGAQVDNFYRDLQRRLGCDAGSEVGEHQLPLLRTGWGYRLPLPGMPQDQIMADGLAVGTNFFATMHIPFLAGRL